MNGRGRFANLPSLVEQEDDPSEATAIAKGYDPKALSHANEANTTDETPATHLSSHDSVPADSGVRVRPRGLVGTSAASGAPEIPGAPAVPRLYGDEPNEEVTAKLQLSPKERLLGEGWHTLVPRLAVDLRAIVAAHIVRGRACMFLSCVDGTTSLGELARASNVSREEAIELVKNLEKRGLLRFS